MEKKRKKLKAVCNSKEYEKNKTTKFLAKWELGQPWLQHDHNKGMIWEWCSENKQTLVAQNVLNSTRFIDGCTTAKQSQFAEEAGKRTTVKQKQYY